MRMLEFASFESLDFPKLMGVYYESNVENAAEFFPDEADPEKGRRMVEQKFYYYLKDDFFRREGVRYYALEADGQWVSAVRLFPVSRSDGEKPEAGAAKAWYAEALETAPSCRRKGFARKMMLLLFDRLGSEGQFEITDTVSKTNAASLQFHLDCGFEVYRDPACCILNGKINENAVTMRYRSR